MQPGHEVQKRSRNFNFARTCQPAPRWLQSIKKVQRRSLEGVGPNFSLARSRSGGVGGVKLIFVESHFQFWSVQSLSGVGDSKAIIAYQLRRTQVGSALYLCLYLSVLSKRPFFFLFYTPHPKWPRMHHLIWEAGWGKCKCVTLQPSQDTRGFAINSRMQSAGEAHLPPSSYSSNDSRKSKLYIERV